MTAATASESATPEMRLTVPTGERRRRARVVGETQGWVLPTSYKLSATLPDEADELGQGGWEIRMHDVSRLGAGFVSAEPLAVGEVWRLRIGRGPADRSRLARVVVCRRQFEGTFAIGVEFADGQAKPVARPLAKAG